jgi:hypothetical protein
MYNVELENSLILVDIVSQMVDYCSVQPDLDESKAKSAEIVAQRIDLARLIGKDNVTRCVETPQGTELTGADLELRNLVIPPLVYFTYARLLRMFQGTFTDSGFALQVEAEDRGNAKSVANEMASIAETFMEDVFTFLEAETPDDENVKPEGLTPRIRRFGGKESRSSN